MHFIIHFLSAVCISIGFIVFYIQHFKKTVALGLIFLLVGLGVGMNQHLAQDEIMYSREGYLHHIVYVREHTKTPIGEALCLVLHNNNTICNEYDGGKNE